VAAPTSLFAEALFGVTKLGQSVDEMFNAYSAVRHHRPNSNSKDKV